MLNVSCFAKVMSIICVHVKGRNNLKKSGSQQDYLDGKFGSPQICLVASLKNIQTFCGSPPDYCYHHLW